ncbi:Uncharacterised protein [Chlamydia trachomatis]|nr:Uncharacterised protein [Chlamydia trachomatis]
MPLTASGDSVTFKATLAGNSISNTSDSYFLTITFIPSFKKFNSHSNEETGISICSNVSWSIKTTVSPALYK